MGISGLLPFVKNYTKRCNLRTWSGKTAAIDASCWLHKALSVSIKQRGNRERCGDIFRSYLQIVKGSGVIPVVVFDGLSLPAKEKENERRRKRRESLLKKADDQSITPEDANRIRSQAVSISFEDIVTCIEICKAEQVDYLVSPYESDAQITFMVLKGLADFAISEDSDILVYGCAKAMVKVTMAGDGDLLVLADILKGLELSMNQLQKMCIAAGCDYLPSLKGIGICRFFQLVTQKQDIMEMLSLKGASDVYKEQFKKVEAVFKHQTVFDMETCATVPLYMPQIELPDDVQHLCGDKLSNAFANDLVVGNIDTKSGQKVNNFPHLRDYGSSLNQEQPLVCSSTGTSNDDANCQEFKCEIIHIDWLSSTFWKIPNFPVMTLEFIFVQFRKGEEICNGVIEKRLSHIQPGSFTCTSHCQIQIYGKDYTVLWKLALSAETYLDQEPDETTDDQQDETIHCLPFKVLGTCYSPDRQRALEEAFLYLEEYNRPVFAKLEAEPDNAIDKRAIAVYLMSSGEYEKVGYIAKELTKFVHPVLNDTSFEVTVQKIRFCTTYRMIGYYLTVGLTKKGLWDKAVVSASKRVR